jgi:hypothetical protein
MHAHKKAPNKLEAFKIIVFNYYATACFTKSAASLN